MIPNCFRIFKIFNGIGKVFSFGLAIKLNGLISTHLYSVHCLSFLALSRRFCIYVISGENQSGKRLHLTRLFFFIGAWLFKCFIIILCHTAKSSSTVDRFEVNEIRSFSRSFRNRFHQNA